MDVMEYWWLSFQLCSIQVAKPLKIIFEYRLLSCVLPEYWKFANIQPIHKKLKEKLFKIPCIPT